MVHGHPNHHHIIAPRPVRVSSGPLPARGRTPEHTTGIHRPLSGATHHRRRSSVGMNSSSPTTKPIHFDSSELDATNLVLATTPPRSPYSFESDELEELLGILTKRIPPPSPSPDYPLLLSSSRTGAPSRSGARSSQLARRRSQKSGGTGRSLTPVSVGMGGTASSPIGWLASPISRHLTINPLAARFNDLRLPTSPSTTDTLLPHHLLLEPTSEPTGEAFDDSKLEEDVGMAEKGLSLGETTTESALR